MGASQDKEYSLPSRSSFSSVPDAFWMRSAIVLERDQKTGETIVKVNLAVLDKVEEVSARWIQSFSTLQGWKEFLKGLQPRSFDSAQMGPSKSKVSVSLGDQIDNLERRSHYLDQVKEAQELIREGEIYQVNLSQLFQFQNKFPPFLLFLRMNRLNPAPFSAYFRQGGVTIISTSPERFLSKKRERLESRPIKGTIRRGKTKDEDERLKEILLTSPKERGELVMITDLMRNDLSKISLVGSVKVLELWRCERYTNVFHLLSVVASIANSALKPLEIIRSCFPPGSVTGCPKLRAMEVIDLLENRSRGLYTGSIGYVTGKGDFDLNVAIRTIIHEKDLYSLQLGSGIVIDSDPDQEYEEILAKGASFFQLLQRESQNLGEV